MSANAPTTILVVDDNDATRYSLSRILKKEGFHVREAATGMEALRQAAERPDLVILDIKLPDITGLEVCQRIKADPATAPIPVLHLSASFADSENRSLGLEAGADGYLVHPVEPRELIAQVRALLRVRRAERAAREQRELLHVTLHSIGDAVISTDARGRITFLNPAAQTLTGWAAGQALGRPLAEVFRPVNDQTREPAGDPVECVLREGGIGSQITQAALITPDGAQRFIDASAASIRDTEGRTVGVVIVFRDVTERRRAEKEIARLLAREQRQTERLRRLTSASLAINAAQGLENMLQVITEEARSIIGSVRAASSLFLSEADSPALRAVACADGCPAAREEPVSFAARRLGGPVRMTAAQWEGQGAGPAAAGGILAAPLLGRNGRNLGVIQLTGKLEGEFTEEDESFLAQLAQAAAAAVENALLLNTLRESDRLKDEFLAMLGHELRNPLAPISNALHLMRLADPTPARPEVEDARSLMERQVEHMVRLVDDLLDVSRITSGKVKLHMEVVDVAVVVARAVEGCRPLIERRKHTLWLDLPEEPLPVEADLVRLAQVLWNLLSNAAKYTPEGGQIRLTVARAPAPPAAGGEGARHDQVVVRVRDSGVGIRPELLPKIFDLFTQDECSLDRTDAGLGLGLTLVKRLTEMHGGTVRASSEGPGRGSEMEICLPLLSETSGWSPAAPPAAPEWSTPRAARRILVVDDNRDSAESLAVLLRLFGHEVQTAFDGAEGVRTALEYRPEVVLMDIGLPVMDGLEACRRLRRAPELAGTAMVAMTGYGQAEDKRQAQEAGFDAHLIKPVDLDALQELLGGCARPAGLPPG